MNRPRAIVALPFLPAPDRESGALRLHHHVELLCELGWEVVVVAHAASPDDDRLADRWRRRGIPIIVAPGSAAAEIFAAYQADVAIVAFWHIAELWMPLLRRVAPQTRVLVDSIDLHFVRKARGAFSATIPSALDAEFASQCARELNVYAAADAVLVVSPDEAELVDTIIGRPGLAHTVRDHETIELESRPPSERTGVVFVGNFRHPPNVEALDVLLDEIVPRIDPDLLARHRISIVGNALDIIERTEWPTGVDVVGWVPSVLPHLASARVSISPLRHGAGTKRKVLQSLLVGTPVVTTPIGAEGLGLVPDRDARIASEPVALARALEALLTDDDQADTIAAAGRRAVADGHDRDGARGALAEVIDRVRGRAVQSGRLADENLRLHRKNLLRDYERYAALTARLRTTVERETAEGSIVAVISRGDDDLVRFRGRHGCHFPATDDGRPLGHHPADDADAVRRLRLARQRGVTHLLIPATETWWLEHYREWADELARIGRALVTAGDLGALYALDPLERSGAPSRRTDDVITVEVS